MTTTIEAWRRAEGAEVLLTMLWVSDRPYNEQLQVLISDVFVYQIEEFFYKEIFSKDGVIKIDVRRLSELEGENGRIYASLNDEERELLNKCALAYFLNCLHNRRLSRCAKTYYELNQHDTFLSGCVIHAAVTYGDGNILNSALEKFQSSDMSSLLDKNGLRGKYADLIYDLARNSEFIFGSDVILPKSKKEPVLCFTVGTERFDYAAITDFAQAVEYFCHNNLIARFDSLSALWLSATGTPRAKSIVSLRPTDRDLSRFAICLALPLEAYYLLQRLRDENPAFQAQIKKPTHRTRGKSQKEFERERLIEDFIRQAKTRLDAIKNTSKEARENPELIPRFMLVRATLDLVRNGYSGLVDISDDELDSLGLSQNDKEEFLKLYAKSGTRRIGK